jgi:hypothetical protein
MNYYRKALDFNTFHKEIFIVKKIIPLQNLKNYIMSQILKGINNPSCLI